MINLVGLIVMALFGILGYFRGALRTLASLAAFFVAGFLAFPLSGIGAALLRPTGLVPRSLLGVAGTVLTGVLVFLIIIIPLDRYLSRRQTELKALEHEMDIWDRFGGALFGLAWGTCLTVLVLVGLQTAGQTQRAMRAANAEIEYRADRRQKETLRVQKIAQVTHQPVSRVPNLQIELADVDEKMLKPEPPSRVEEWATQIEGSVFSPMVRQANPLDRKAEAILRNLAVTVADPALLERFQDHPQVIELMTEPRILALAQDPEIAQAIHQQRYRDLLDNVKLAEAASDKALAAKLKNLNIEQLLKDVKSVNWAPRAK